MPPDENAADVPTEPNPPARGFYTSEFWLTVLGVVALLILVLANKLDGEWAAAAIGASTLGYNATRGVVKAAQLKGDTQVSAFKAELGAYTAATVSSRQLPPAGSIGGGAAVMPANEVAVVGLDHPT